MIRELKIGTKDYRLKKLSDNVRTWYRRKETIRKIGR
jgi:hypothetical protein